MAAHNALSWEEFVKRGKQHNKTVICEVEKRGRYRYFRMKCDLCGEETNKILRDLIRCKKCALKNITSNNEDFILKANIVHLEKFDYSLVEYINSETKVKIKCNNCNNIFEQRPNSHLSGYGCTNCALKNRASNNIDFIRKANIVHHGKFDYSLVEYTNTYTKVKIICNTCNKIFEQIPNSHLSGYGCTNCTITKKTNTKNNFVLQSIKKHEDKYSYILVEYTNAYTKVKIICNTCNKIFEQRPAGHLSGYGCPYCGLGNRLSNTDDFKLKCKNVHGDKYNYEFVDYLHSLTEVKILCNKCNQIFEQKPSTHLSGSGCPKCNESKGEIKVAQHIKEKNIKFTPQKTFQTLRNIKLLKCDFYLEDLNLLIEYDGKYHYKPVRGSTPENKQKNLEDCQRRDKIKDEWAKANNIPLLRIPYWDYDRIEELIDAFILQHTRKKEVKQLVLEM